MKEAQKDQKIQNMVEMAKFQNYIYNQKNSKMKTTHTWSIEQMNRTTWFTSHANNL
jgi:hypothetical protein